MGAFLAAVLLITTYLPGVMVLAAPQYFSRPGAGVNATPLDVLSFSGSEFGDVSDAVNLVNGNVYLDLGALSRNNTLKPGEDTAGSFGNFKTNGILRLAGFSPTMTTVPTEWSLGVGDGSYQVFRRATTAEIAAAPSWIKERYAMQAGVTSFISKPLAGTQVDEQWIITYKRSDNRYVSHHYSHSGTRTTFLNDGEYADFTQTPHEQYRTAKASNTPDGADGVTGTTKTQFTYLGVNSGRILRVEDGWGRVTTYQWNPDNTLESVSLLVQNTADTASWARRIEYAYKDFGGQKMVWYMGFRTFDGRGGFVGRWFSFNYKLVGSAWLLDWVKRPIMASGGAGDMGINQNLTTYNYDGTGRVSNITETNKPVTTFVYGATTNPAAVGGTRVTRTIGLASDANRKVTTYDYTTDGWLRTLTERDYNPVTGVERNLATTYWPNATGQMLAVNLASGAQTQSIYDAHGNLVHESIYKTPVNWAATPPAGFVRTKTYKYNPDNQLVSDLTPVTPGGDTTTGLYNYGQVEDVTTYTSHAAVTASNQTFKAISASNMLRTVTGVSDNPQGLTTTISEAGLVTGQVKSGTGMTSLTTTLSYFGNRATNTELKAVNFLQATLPATGSAVVYGDMVSVKVEGGRREEYEYDRAGNLSHTIKRTTNVFGWSGSTPQYADTESWTTLNGWGQPVFQLIREWHAANDVKDVQASAWTYCPSGELTASWVGMPTNLTLYAVNASTGRLDETTRGPSSGMTLTAVRNRTKYRYDVFSRVDAVWVNEDNATVRTYDTLDRVVKTITPDGGQTVTTYAWSGGVQSSALTELNGTVITTSLVRDTLNRETSRTVSNGTTVTTVYDAFDRPIAITDNRLTMLGSAADRTTYLKYDSQGNLIKRLDPALVTATAASSGTGRSYIDDRRPYTEWTFDNWNRLTGQKVLLTGTVTPSNLEMPAGAGIASTTTRYDSLGRPDLVTDAEGYTTGMGYDGNDNLISNVQQIWKTSEPGYAESVNGFTSIVVRNAYDALGRQTLRSDGRTNNSVAAYDILGNVTAVQDGRGVVTKHMTYTPDGLVERVYEPDNNTATQTTSLTSLTGYVVTEFNVYPTEETTVSDGTQPATTWRAHMNTQAGLNSGARTDYMYDYAGRVVRTTLPEYGGVRKDVYKTYDVQGHVVLENDLNGFGTRSTFNTQGLLTSTVEAARPGSATDIDAGLANGLSNSYDYDAAGNLTRKTERNLVTEYRYNSLGRVILESRPRVGSSASATWKLLTYRLDGLPTARTSYSYSGNLTSRLSVSRADDGSVSVDYGNLTLFEYNGRGELWAKWSLAAGRTPEVQMWQRVNGAGQRYQRVFLGNSGIYAEQKANEATPLGHANSLSYWKFDASGNLSEKWDTPMNGSSWLPRDLNDKQNRFSYTYSPSDKEMTQSRDIRVRQQSKVVEHPLYTSYGGVQGVMLAASVATVTTTYTEREQIERSTSTDNTPSLDNNAQSRQDLLGGTITRHQRYSYYLDGRVLNSWAGDGTTDQGYKGVENYDQLGREIQVYDSNGGRGNQAPGRIYTTYSADGTVTIWGERNGATVFNSVVVPTVGGLTASMQSPTEPNPTKYVYNVEKADEIGQAKVTTGGVTVTNKYAYDAWSNLVGILQVAPGLPDKQIFGANHNDDNFTFLELKRDRNDTLENLRYNLDSRGNRLSVTGGTSDGFKKRYTPDDQVSQYNVFIDKPTQTCSFVCGESSAFGIISRYNEFRYDPFGQQVLSSTGQIGEQNSLVRISELREFAVWRDWNIVYSVQGQVQSTIRKAGNYSWRCRMNSGSISCDRPLESYYSNGGWANSFRDATYSGHDGYDDNTAWDGTRPFALVNNVQPLDAPVQSLSGMLKINPLDVVTSSLPNLPNPGQITGAGVEPKDVAGPVQTGAAQDQKQMVGGGTAPPYKAGSTASAPAQGSILTLEIKPNFDDGEGFGFPVYANNVQALSGKPMLDPGDGGTPVSPTGVTQTQQASQTQTVTNSQPTVTVSPAVAPTPETVSQVNHAVGNMTVTGEVPPQADRDSQSSQNKATIEENRRAMYEQRGMTYVPTAVTTPSEANAMVEATAKAIISEDYTMPNVTPAQANAAITYNLDRAESNQHGGMLNTTTHVALAPYLADAPADGTPLYIKAVGYPNTFQNGGGGFGNTGYSRASNTSIKPGEAFKLPKPSSRTPENFVLPKNFPPINPRVNTQNNTHIGGPGHKGYKGSSYMQNRQDAQKVLDAYHSGDTKPFGVKNSGSGKMPIVRYDGVTGIYRTTNSATGVTSERPTNIFWIKGGQGKNGPEIVPLSPNWKP